MAHRDELLQLMNSKLESSRVRDYCPNGLQVEGKAKVRKILTGVTASQALLDRAVAEQADAILVHHGYFWKNEASEITGMKKRRLQTLLQHDINLFAYHLPLDIHPDLGNNAQLGALLGFGDISALASVEPIGVVRQTQLSAAVQLTDMVALLQQKLERSVFVHDAGIGEIRHIAWCTGGGQGYIDAAAAAGAQLFISGEVSEQTIHSANELGIHFIAAGHHATERYGVKALGEWLATQTDVEVVFADIYNPA
ncbi:Nif3-like dinuclear metal center hexameric protein [Rheinheimera texasensis]|uniref:Nif3-like dinuclear metal center hexameric protein n=1 Tax=Rheinheimera texasensis TaxID=306205 RepID=UPI0004E196C8|nr:Nif3-like dinuclear metal center hexameric protein [Rheinheimera texasensis]